MVTIVSYNKRTSEAGKEFFSLTVQSGIEMIRSKTTGQFYATAKKASIASTFDELTCKALIGTEMPGSISKEACEPYNYTLKETGEVIVLTHRYTYLPDESNRFIKDQEPLKADTKAFSSNGVHEMSPQ